MDSRALEEKETEQELLSMHPGRGIVRTYNWPDGISTKPNDQNTITRQSADRNNAPR